MLATGCNSKIVKAFLAFLALNTVSFPLALFAVDESISPSSKQQTVTAVTEEQAVVVDLFINDRPAGIQICYESHDDLWVPFELFHKHVDLPAVSENDQIMQFMTSLGPIHFNLSTLQEFEGKQCISFAMLKERFHVHPLFNEYLYTVKILIPWKPVTSSKQKEKKISVTPDISAPGKSLSFLHFETDISHSFQDSNTDHYLELEAGGRIGPGMWDIVTTGNKHDKLSLSQYHWTTLSKNTVLRIGTGTSQIYNLVENPEYTGVQIAWNNRNILQNLDDMHYSDSDALLNIDRTQRRTIEGTGPPGGIAELRFDGRIAARQRISFDGKFIFSNVRMTTDLRITKVYIYEYSTLEQPLRIIDYTQSSANRSLARHEMLFHCAVGRSGNPLDEDYSGPTSLTGFTHILYGLNERVTLEGSMQYDPYEKSTDQLLGLIMSVGSRWNTSLYSAQSNGRFGADISIFGYGKNWRVSQRSQWNEKGFGYDTREHKERHIVRLQARPFSWMNAFVYGNYTKENNLVTSKHLLPGGYLHLFPRTRLSIIPDDNDGKYSYEVYLRARRDTDMQFRYEDKIISTNINHDLRNGTNTLQLYHSFAPKNQTHASSVHFNWHPGNSRNDRIQLGASHMHGRFGFSGSWSKEINSGLSAILSYNDNMFNASGLSIEDSPFLSDSYDNHTISLSITWDLGYSGKRFYPINRSAISQTRGGMAGALKIMTDANVSQSSINDVSILLNGRTLGQRQIGGTFFVGNLRPGIYTVSVDPENLPLEMVVERQNIKVEVQSGAVTEVNIPVFTEYGAAGMVCTASEHMLVDVPVSIVDSSGKTVKRTRTDQFGHYRVDGLRQGNYTAKVTTTKEGEPDHVTEKDFTIKKDFLFEIDIIVPESHEQQ